MFVAGGVGRHPAIASFIATRDRFVWLSGSFMESKQQNFAFRHKAYFEHILAPFMRFCNPQFRRRREG